MINIEDEENRLLNSIELKKMFDDEFKIEISNIGLKVIKYLNMTGHSFTIFADVKMDFKELKKYYKKDSKITINFTLYGKHGKIIDADEISIYFDGGLIDSEFKGSKTIKYEFNDLILKDIKKIKMQVDADLNKISGDELEQTPLNIKKQIENNNAINEERTRILNSIERISEIEEKYGINIESVGLNISNKCDMVFFIDVTITSTDWSYLEFKCVLYDKNNTIIDSTFTNINSNSFIGFDTLTFVSIPYYNNIDKIKIYPSNVAKY